ncbi:MAG TPA: hypothetical protein P5186_00245 [Candidatus Paceibacterota bacterium]|nr:hypothetical protein [Verrucomicrobiota bacterium]HRY46455.1 hypothetical protein [Candidatus Paceibacterota bacterium]HSA03684.1 hypothetical protein [Candidatus Paceibacterota bacterium]
MKGKIKVDFLPKGWIHSHEEDSETEMVLRPPDYAFPRARGRNEYLLEENGTLVAQVPGPADRPVTVTGKWRVSQDGGLEFSFPDKESRHFVIASLSKDRLVLRKTASKK